MKCRSIRYVAKENVELIDIDVADPGPGEVLVRTLACGICAWDLHVFAHGPEGTCYPGHEGVGVVIKRGAGVTNFDEGDWVVGGQLGFGEYYTMPAAALYKLPRGEKRAEHWIIEPVACIVNGLDLCALKAGDRIAVVGCGFMGLMFIQALSRSLVDQLIAIDVNPKRLELAKRFGATEMILASEADVEALHNRSIDTVVDCSGNQKGLDLSSKIVRRGGRLNLFGWNHGTTNFPGDLWHMNGLTVVNASPGASLRNPWPIAIRLLDRGQIDLSPLVTHIEPLARYPEMLREITSNGREDYIKGVIRVVGVNSR
ncbi:MAG TPA: zinc-binding dehydrogenase [Tepidisphaeraceae bacterium]|nr:zinc-binding dehydrogenase [Tepidisphaeraceae bacterium]